MPGKKCGIQTQLGTGSPALIRFGLLYFPGFDEQKMNKPNCDKNLSVLY